MSLFEDASLVVTPNGRKAGKIYSIKPTDGSGDLTVVRATTKTEVNASGVIVDVPINVPSFDYSNGSCPSILVEPQRTNLLTYSEEFDNASWIKINTTITTNSTNSPSGTLTADKLIEISGGNIPRLIYIFTATIGQNYTLSFYLKSAERNQVRVVFEGDGNNKSAFFNSNTGVVSGIGYNTMSSMILLNNGWYRCSITISAGSSSSSFYIATAENNVSILSGDNTKGIYIWGAQLEAGSNATSYIPTVASAVTRNADVISKTGIADLIGQTEGTVFIDVNLKNNTNDSKYILSLSDGTSANRMYVRFLNKKVSFVRNFSTQSGSTIFSNLLDLPIGIYKIIISYKSGNTSLFVNGLLIGNSNATYNINLSQINLGASYNNLQEDFLNDSINTIALFKTQLTDQQCIDLTTI